VILSSSKEMKNFMFMSLSRKKLNKKDWKILAILNEENKPILAKDIASKINSNEIKNGKNLGLKKLQDFNLISIDSRKNYRCFWKLTEKGLKRIKNSRYKSVEDVRTLHRGGEIGHDKCEKHIDYLCKAFKLDYRKKINY
jgi:DNA-binding MarR family transcriptional regulator